jgi:hypothetical protein
LVLVEVTDTAKQKFDIIINYQPGPVADEAHRSHATVKLSWGPLGTAKTTWLVWRAYDICERAAKAGFTARCLFVRDTYRNLIDSTFQTFKEWLPPGTAIGFVSHSDPAEYKLNVGGRYHDVLFRHGQTEQDASMFLSTEYDFIGLEEIAPAYLPGEKKVSPGIAEGVFDMAISRLTRKADRAAAVRPELCMTCNSPPLTHWASRRIIDKSDDYLKAVNWAHWMFPISDNAHNLRDDYYSNLELVWEGKRSLIRRFLKGERLAVFIGLPRFNLDQLDILREKAVEPPFRGWLTPTPDNILHVQPEANAAGNVRMWSPPRGDKRYVIGADVAEGIEGGDYSAAYVLDRADCSIAAAWHGHIEPQLFGEELAKLGTLYNTATIGIESNNHGLATINALQRTGYTRIYAHKSIDLRTRGIERVGIRTDQRTKPLIIDGVGAYLEALGKDGNIVDRDLISELQTFGVDELGRTGAQENCFDDRVIAFSCALLVNQRDGLERVFSNLNKRAVA